MYKKILLENAGKIHTTEMGLERLRKNLEIEFDAVSYCKSVIEKSDSEVIKKGKNYYVYGEGCVITVNASSFTIITAHKK